MADSKNNTFTIANVSRVAASLSSYHTTDTVCTLYIKGDMSPEVLTAFANLAKVLKLPVTATYGNLTINQRKPESEIRDAAIHELQRQYERGEVDIDGNPASQD